MDECTVCGTSNVLTRTCNYCGRTFCSTHTLPENHDCSGIEGVGEQTKHLQSEIDAKLKGELSGERTALDGEEPTESPASDSRGERVREAEANPNREKTAPRDSPRVGDSGPDVAPDGSLVREENELDSELERIRRNASDLRGRWFGRAAVSVKIGLKRAKTLFFDLRLWLLVGILLTADYAGYLDIPLLPV